MKKNVLTLTVSKQWFDMIVADEKTDEYREIKPHDVPYHLKEDIEDELQKCISDSEVYELILRINHRLNIANCFERGFRGHVPIRFADEIASYDIFTVLNKKTPPPGHHD